MTYVARILTLALLLAFAGLACGEEAMDPTAVPESTAPAPTAAATESAGATEAMVEPTAAPAATEATEAPEETGPTEAREPTATTEREAAATPDPATAAPPPTEAPEPSPVPEDTPTPSPTDTPEPEPTTADTGAGPGSFVVGDGSQITFTVAEETRFAPVRFDAVIAGTGLSGFANLDGSPSEVVLDLHSLESDQDFRDRYIRDRMFPSNRTATVTVDRLPDLPQSFFGGEETSGKLDGSLKIGDRITPLTFEVVARHDGTAINVLGKTTFTWDQLGLAKPVFGPVTYLGDEVRVQVLIVARAP